MNATAKSNLISCLFETEKLPLEEQIVSKDLAVKKFIQKVESLPIGVQVVLDDLNDPTSIVGIVSERDVIKKVLAKKKDVETTMVGEIMTTNVLILNENEKLLELIRAFREKKIRHVPVVDGQKKIVQVLTEKNIISYLASKVFFV